MSTRRLRPSRVKRKFGASEPVLIVAVDLHENMVELASLIGFDAVWVDMEHPSVSLERVASLIRAARSGLSDVVVRVPRWGFTAISRVLEAGAQGIIYPHCQSAAEAAQVVAWAKFPPVGSRPVYGLGPDAAFGLVNWSTYVQSANDEVFVLLLIEEPVGVENAPAIASVPGVDGLYFGRGDYAASAGLLEARDPAAMKTAMQAVGRAATDAGKTWGAAASDEQEAASLLSDGAGFVSHGRDVTWIRAGMMKTVESFAGLGFRFAARGD